MVEPKIVEEPTRFSCEGETLIGVFARPASSPTPRIGVVIVVGGPQYRVGSHRQFVLLARSLASAGWPVLRFDYRGMGDSTGERRDFQSIALDIRAAVDELHRLASGIEGTVLWGLCDAASASLMYAPADSRIVGLALANPWARAPQTYAKAHLRHYYLQRALSPAFWRKLFSGTFSFRQSVRDLAGSLGQAIQHQPTAQGYRGRMLEGLQHFKGQVLWLLSGRDLTALEFITFMEQQRQGAYLSPGEYVSRVDLQPADHTFAHPDWRNRVEVATREWLDFHWRSRPVR